MHTPGPWWSKNGIIYARARTWTPDSHVCFPIARLDLRRDDGPDNAQLVAAAPDMLEALQEIAKISIDTGLVATRAETPARNLAVDIYILAAEAIIKTQETKHDP